MPPRKEKALPAGMYRCEHRDGAKKCEKLATVFQCGQHRCDAHKLPGDPLCSHSLAPSGFCSYCGHDMRKEG